MNNLGIQQAKNGPDMHSVPAFCAIIYQHMMLSER